MFSSLFYIFGGIGLKKKARKQLLLGSLLSASLAVSSLSFSLTAVGAENGSTLRLRLLETDIHTNIVITTTIKTKPPTNSVSTLV